MWTSFHQSSLPTSGRRAWLDRALSLIRFYEYPSRRCLLTLLALKKVVQSVAAAEVLEVVGDAITVVRQLEGARSTQKPGGTAAQRRGLVVDQRVVRSASALHDVPMGTNGSLAEIHQQAKLAAAYLNDVLREGPVGVTLRPFEEKIIAVEGLLARSQQPLGFRARIRVPTDAASSQFLAALSSTAPRWRRRPTCPS